MFDPNGLYYKKLKYFHEHVGQGNKIEMCDEGGTRSGKTWDNIHLIETYCDHNRGKKKDIGVFRDTLVNCKDYTLKEFEKCYSAMGREINIFNPAKPSINRFGNNIYFRGLADESKQEAAPFDVVYINEVLDIDSESLIAGLKMRCKDLLIFDWNPKVSDHWVFNYEKHPNCLFTHSTYKNNRHLPESIIREIESYNPWHPDDSELPEKQRRPHPVNVANGTADPYRWNVYGLGLRCSPEGLVFPNVTWIDQFPTEVERTFYGLDFGYTVNPSALVKVGVMGNNIYLQLLLYEPIDNAGKLANDYLIHLLPKDKICWCDKADPGMISDLRGFGFTTVAAEKWDGCVNYRIDVMKRYKIHIVKNPDFRKEQENYRYRVVQGIRLNEPEKKYDHAWDAAGYACQHELR